MNPEKHELEYIWNAIIQEREYQDTHKGQDGRNKHEIPGWILIIKKQLDTAAIEWLDGDIDKSLAEVLQATAVGVACLQQHGVPDAALREGVDKSTITISRWQCTYCPAINPNWVRYCGNCNRLRTRIKDDIIAENEKPLPVEVEVKGFDRFKVYAWNDMYLVRFIDFTKEQRQALVKFMRGQTMPTIEGAADPYGWAYLHDFENFLAGGQLFWD